MLKSEIAPREAPAVLMSCVLRLAVLRLLPGFHRLCRKRGARSQEQGNSRVRDPPSNIRHPPSAVPWGSPTHQASVFSVYSVVPLFVAGSKETAGTAIHHQTSPIFHRLFLRALRAFAVPFLVAGGGEQEAWKQPGQIRDSPSNIHDPRKNRIGRRGRFPLIRPRAPA